MKVNPKKKSQNQNAEEVIEEVAVENAEVEATEETVAEQPAVAEVSQSKKGLVRITFMKDLNPPPHVGNFDFAREFKITKVSVQSSYDVPRHVAAFLVDSRLVVANL